MGVQRMGRDGPCGAGVGVAAGDEHGEAGIRTGIGQEVRGLDGEGRVPSMTRPVTVGTLYNHMPDLEELRTSRVPHQLESGQRQSAGSR